MLDSQTPSKTILGAPGQCFLHAPTAECLNTILGHQVLPCRTLGCGHVQLKRKAWAPWNSHLFSPSNSPNLRTFAHAVAPIQNALLLSLLPTHPPVSQLSHHFLVSDYTLATGVKEHRDQQRLPSTENSACPEGLWKMSTVYAKLGVGGSDPWPSPIPQTPLVPGSWPSCTPLP